ncbi:MAG: alpha/beta fold hydrolase [Chloroflexi bacterium]|nr:alpha/beta fold hydrolase [Chloroflexota bacterium]
MTPELPNNGLRIAKPSLSERGFHLGPVLLIGYPLSWRYWRNLLIFALAVAVLAFSVAYPYLQAYRLLHPPRAQAQATPADLGLTYEDVVFPSQGALLQGWFIPATRREAIILVHGTPGERSSLLALVPPLHHQGYPILLFDLRAHGTSGGAMTTLGYLETDDVLAAVDFLSSRQEVDSEAIGALGLSLGAAAVLRAAGRSPQLRAIVADSSYSDLPALIRDQSRLGPPLWRLTMPLIWAFGEWQAGFRAADVSPLAAMPRISPRPVLLIHGTADDLVPYSHSERLYAAASNSTELWLVPDAGHVGALGMDEQEYDQRVVAFFDRAFAS